MSNGLPEPHVEQAGPAELRDPLVRQELRRASVWIGLVLAALGVIVLSAQLLFGALLGIVGLALADPMVAMLKTGLEQKSKEDEADAALA
jgi:hypothetical protein